MDHKIFMEAIKPYILEEKFGENDITIYTVVTPTIRTVINVHDPADRIERKLKSIEPPKYKKTSAGRKPFDGTIITPKGNFSSYYEAGKAYGINTNAMHTKVKYNIAKGTPGWGKIND